MLWFGAMNARTILVVDEDAGLCESLDLLLSSYGHAVHTCRGLREARKLVTMANVDTFLLSASSPADELVAFCREQRAAGVAGAFLMLTGAGVPRLDAATLVAEATADGWADKPLKAMEIMRRVQRAATQPAEG